jgi:hypothetical protein
VRDEHERAAVAAEVVFEPGDGLGVEVVGRLVEDEEARAFYQRVRERDAFALPAGERAHPGARVRDAQPAEHRPGVRLQLPRARHL